MALNKKEANILVVDDDKQLADNLVEYLVKLGYSAIATYGGKEAIDRFTQESFHLVITDLMMPEMGGLEVLQAIKELDSRAIVLVITGYGTIHSAVSAIKEGAFDFVPKPFKMSELEVIISRALEHHALFKQLGVFKGLSIGLMISVPFWMILGIVLAMAWK
ncbi:MAG: response regulator [Desulfobacteraceae bacterium]|nr:MAG: response regulator [Desulfobacteraceae bacterium]